MRLSGALELDLKRLATSFVIATRDNGLSESDGKDAVLTCVRSYREHMAEFSEMAALDLWYHALDRGADREHQRPRDPPPCDPRLAKARESSTSEGLFPKLVDSSSGSRSSKTSFRRSFTGKITPWRNPSGHPAGLRPVPRNPGARPSHVARPLRYQRRRDQGRRRRERRHRCSMILLTSGDGDPLILQVRRRGPRSWRPMRARASSPTTDNVS